MVPRVLGILKTGGGRFLGAEVGRPWAVWVGGWEGRRRKCGSVKVEAGCRLGEVGSDSSFLFLFFFFFLLFSPDAKSLRLGDSHRSLSLSLSRNQITDDDMVHYVPPSNTRSTLVLLKSPFALVGPLRQMNQKLRLTNKKLLTRKRFVLLPIISIASWSLPKTRESTAQWVDRYQGVPVQRWHSSPCKRVERWYRERSAGTLLY